MGSNGLPPTLDESTPSSTQTAFLTTFEPIITSSLPSATSTSVRTIVSTFITTLSSLPGDHATTTAVPLTTPFVPSPSCAGRYWVLVLDASTISSGSPDRLFSSCMPASAAIYSPGVCPAPMEPVYVNRVLGDTYTEVCCQSGFSYDLQNCLKSITASSQVLDGRWITSTDVLTQVAAGTATHKPFTVLWAERDLDLFPSDVSARRKSIESSGSRQPTATTSDGGGDPGSGGNVSGASDHAAPGLSSGAIAGIVISAAVAIILVTLIARYGLDWQSKRSPRIGRAPELDGVHTATWKRWHRGAWRAELDSRNVRAELDGGGVAQEPRAELDSGRPRGERPTESSELPDTTPTVQEA